MKSILVVRHAKSSWKEPHQDDHERPLKGRGRGDAPRVGAFLGRRGLTPRRIVSSTAVRARTTAELVAEGAGFQGEIELRPELYLGDPGAYLEAIAESSDDHALVMVVGHNPGVSDLAGRLTGEDVELVTCAVAWVRIGIEKWTEVGSSAYGELCDLWIPRDLPEE